MSKVDWKHIRANATLITNVDPDLDPLPAIHIIQAIRDSQGEAGLFALALLLASGAPVTVDESVSEESADPVDQPAWDAVRFVAASKLGGRHARKAAEIFASVRDHDDQDAALWTFFGALISAYYM